MLKGDPTSADGGSLLVVPIKYPAFMLTYSGAVHALKKNKPDLHPQFGFFATISSNKSKLKSELTSAL